MRLLLLLLFLLRAIILARLAILVPNVLILDVTRTLIKSWNKRIVIIILKKYNRRKTMIFREIKTPKRIFFFKLIDLAELDLQSLISRKYITISYNLLINRYTFFLQVFIDSKINRFVLLTKLL
jgi:hypothetical protein